MIHTTATNSYKISGKQPKTAKKAKNSHTQPHTAAKQAENR